MSNFGAGAFDINISVVEPKISSCTAIRSGASINADFTLELNVVGAPVTLSNLQSQSLTIVLLLRATPDAPIKPWKVTPTAITLNASNSKGYVAGSASFLKDDTSLVAFADAVGDGNSTIYTYTSASGLVLTPATAQASTTCIYMSMRMGIVIDLATAGPVGNVDLSAHKFFGMRVFVGADDTANA
jgi:hypothetical protein